MLFSVETKLTIGKIYLLGLKKKSRCHLALEMGLKMKKRIDIKY